MHLAIQHMVTSEHIRKVNWNQLTARMMIWTYSSLTLDSRSELYSTQSKNNMNLLNCRVERLSTMLGAIMICQFLLFGCFKKKIEKRNKKGFRKHDFLRESPIKLSRKLS